MHYIKKSIFFYSRFIWLLSFISSENEFSSRLLINFFSRDSIFLRLFNSFNSAINSFNNSNIASLFFFLKLFEYLNFPEFLQLIFGNLN